MKTITTLLLAVLLCGSALAQDEKPYGPITLRGANGNEVIATVVSVQPHGLVVQREGDAGRTSIRWAQLDMEHLKANHEELEKRRLDVIDREKNGVFAANPPPVKPVAPPPPPALKFPDAPVPFGSEGYRAELGLKQTTPVTFRDLLGIYASSTGKQATTALRLLRGDQTKSALMTILQQLADDATKSKDGRASIYRRTIDKLDLQFAEKGVRSDAQSAVADLLKALEKK